MAALMVAGFGYLGTTSRGECGGGVAGPGGEGVCVGVDGKVLFV